MKKILVALMTVLTSACLFGACGEGGVKGKWSASKNSNSESSVSSALSESEISNPSSASNEGISSSLSSTDSSTDGSSSSSNSSDSSTDGSSSSSNSSDSSTDTTDNSSSSSNSSSDSSTETNYLYNDFTATEKSQMVEYIGRTIPFLPNNEYEVECYYDEEYEENTVYFCTVGNTAVEFEEYLEKYDAAYSFDGTDVDEEGDTWYYYSKDDVLVDIVYYSYEGEYCMELFAYIPADFIDDDSSNSSSDSSSDSSFDSSEDDSSDSSSSGSGSIEYLYTDFTAEEKSQMVEYIGMTIPFLPNNEYEVECYYDEEYEEDTIYFCTVGNTAAEFEEYLEKYDAAYSFDGTDVDEEGDTWYYYSKGNVFVDIVYYSYEGEYYMELFAYSSYTGSIPDDGGDVGGGDYGEEDVELLPNTGKGLPTSESGVYEVDFTKAEYVKDVHEQGYYINSCPTISGTEKLNILVIPVEFKDITAASKGYDIEKIDKAFNGDAGDTDYYSVREYNYISSYGQLDLNFVVLDSWFCPEQSSSYYAEFKKDVQGTELAIGDQLIMDEALQYLAPIMDLSEFDSDGNGFIDGIVMVNTLEINNEVDFQWAYRYFNYYMDEAQNYYEYDGVSANDYLWAPYQFLYEDRSTGEYDSSLMNTYTFIHEFGHLLGADDYYDTAYIEHPMGGYDIMDSMVADHNPFTKFNYGWLTSSRLIVAEESVTVDLEAFSKNGDTIIIANNWAEELGAYQEYYVLMYYTNEGLNAGQYGLFEEEGILVYHVNATLYVDDSYGDDFYGIYNTNTNYEDSSGYGTLNNLIEFVTTQSGEYVYGVGESLSADVKDDYRESIAYTFTVDSITADSATLTFTKNA